MSVSKIYEMGGVLYSQISYIMSSSIYQILFYKLQVYARRESDSINRCYRLPAIHCAQDKLTMSGDGDKLPPTTSAHKLDLREHPIANRATKDPTHSRQDLVSGCSTGSVRFSPDSKFPVISTALGLCGAFPTQSPIPSQTVKSLGQP